MVNAMEWAQDGITYRLFTYDKEKGLICGAKWSPSKGSDMVESFCVSVISLLK